MLAACLAACTFGDGLVEGTSLGVGSGPGDDGTDDGPVSATAVDTGFGDGPGPDGTTSTDDDGPPTTGTPSAARLELDRAPELVFDSVIPGSDDQQTLEVVNVGGGDATAISASLSESFGFADGRYPGAGGTCGDTLAPGDSCLIVVEFVSPTWGETKGALVIDYGADDGAQQVQLTLLGVTEGTTRNLLDNASFEDEPPSPMDPPPRWVEDNGDWRRIEGNSTDGQHTAYAGSSSMGPQRHALWQDVDISKWAPFVDRGLLSVEFTADYRLFSPNDEGELTLLFLGGRDGFEIGTGLFGTGGWDSFADSAKIPIGTKTLRVELACEKNGGETCDAHFDGLRLRATYPVP